MTTKASSKKRFIKKQKAERNPKGRRKKYKEQKEKEELSHKNYLQDIGKRKLCALHKQSWVKKSIKKFQRKLNQFQLALCTECHERWYAPVNYKPQQKNRISLHKM